MRTASLRKLTFGAVAAGLVLTGCGTTAEGGSASEEGGSDGPITGLRFMVPNSAGSGYDTTAREVARALARVSATAAARRASDCSPRCIAWATLTAVTPTRTTQMMTTCSASSWPASESRRDTWIS